MATTLSTIITRTRINLHEPSPRLWGDAELLAHINKGIKDLWRALNTQYQNFFFTTSTAVTLAASTSTLASIPSDVSTILGLELVTPSLYPGLSFEYKDYNHPDFQSARAADAVDPQNVSVLFFCLTGAGAPTGAPIGYIAPQVTTALALRMTYIPVLGDLVATATNPIPGESDAALEYWTTAMARAKIRPEQAPDPEWLALYATEKANILVAVAPRQEMTDQIAEGVFEGY